MKVNFPLRRLSESLMLICLVQPGYTFRTTVIFGTLKNGCLQIKSQAFSYNLFQLQKGLSKWH